MSIYSDLNPKDTGFSSKTLLPSTTSLDDQGNNKLPRKDDRTSPRSMAEYFEDSFDYGNTFPVEFYHAKNLNANKNKKPKNSTGPIFPWLSTQEQVLLVLGVLSILYFVSAQ